MPEEKSKVIAITGASSGIGAALARAYATNNQNLLLCGRNETRLETVAQECRELGAASVRVSVVNVSVPDEVEAWFSWISEISSLDVVHVNAGVTGGTEPDKEHEDIHDVSALLSINLIGATNTIGAALKVMTKTGHGQIVVTNSLASYVGFPGTPSYCASKAGLRIYCDSLQRSLKSSHIILTQIYPGYVESPMSRKVVSAKPYTKSADEAARLIVRAAAQKKRQMGFPYPMWIGVRLLGILPHFFQNLFIPLFDMQMDMKRK